MVMSGMVIDRSFSIGMGLNLSELICRNGTYPVSIALLLPYGTGTAVRALAHPPAQVINLWGVEGRRALVRPPENGNADSAAFRFASTNSRKPKRAVAPAALTSLGSGDKPRVRSCPAGSTRRSRSAGRIGSAATVICSRNASKQQGQQ